MWKRITFVALMSALLFVPNITLAQSRGGGKGGPPSGGRNGGGPRMGGGMPGGMGQGGGKHGGMGQGKGGGMPGGMGQGGGKHGGIGQGQGMGQGGGKHGGMGQGKGGGMPGGMQGNQGMGKGGHGPGGKKPLGADQSGSNQSVPAQTSQTNALTSTTKQAIQIQMAQLLSVQSRLAQYQPRTQDETVLIAQKQQSISTQLQALQQKLSQLPNIP